MSIVKNTFSELKLQQLLNDLLVILSDKEKAVITKRFALDNAPRQTLEKIGEKFLVTRERVRQIEASALKKLQRNILNTKLNLVNTSALEILEKHGNILMEKKLISGILNQIFHTSPVDGQIIRLALTVNKDIVKVESPRQFSIFWCTKDIDDKFIRQISNMLYKVLKKSGDVMIEKEIYEKTKNDFKLSPAFIVSVLEIDFRFKKIDNTWGLSEWRHVNPKSIRDKASIVLKKAGKPLHFVDIANKIMKHGFDQKAVTTQAVHNDLIRYSEFVLVGRGLYALKDWGYESGTVADVIARILKKHGPIKKKEVVKKVLEQRDVKIGTISLNLQKSPAFIRVGRAVYDFDESKWDPQSSGRGRKKRIK